MCVVLVRVKLVQIILKNHKTLPAMAKREEKPTMTDDSRTLAPKNESQITFAMK